jgi:myo-inositol-hexaphosphate 3-phosphohydrolase
MKKQNNFFLILFTISIAISCSEENVSDVFEEVNGDVAVKLMESISVSDTEDSSDNTTVTMYYTNDGKLNTISDGNQTNVFVYDNDNKLTRIPGKLLNTMIIIILRKLNF